VYLVFDGIFRDSRVWVNGFYLGGEPSGYAEQRYDITPYLSDGDDNIITVRSDATLEEGWFYEGGGIYRHAWLETAPPIHVKPSTLKVSYGVTDTEWGGPLPTVNVSGTVVNASHRLRDQGVIVRVELIDTDGNPVGGNSSTAISIPSSIAPMGEAEWSVSLRPEALRLWSPSSPSLYDVRVTVDEPSGKDVTTVRTGFRTLSFDADKGLAINGEPVRLYGVNQHQDHAGVGAGIPDAVNVYRLKELKKYGVNTIRTSHNPATPEMLAACDSLGLLVVEENRLLGVNDYHVGQFKKMIDRDFNHPSVIMWSAGNEEWGVEWDKRGTEIVSQLRDVVNGLDPTRPMAAATSGGPTTVISPDVAGYNYIMQNPVEKYRTEYPERIAFGSEETTGCGTRGVYFDDRENGRMASMNRVPELERDSVYNRIARGWKFYRDRPWLLGLCYWTGFDYRGEPNPLKYPATGSQFGLLDYAGFPKDEAYYIKSQWVDEPMVHILPHWNLEGHEGETIPVWVYGNVDEVE
ncbi:MAG: beta-galactosidase, partial [Duncaniella sp.]|nr:beta-galactosidase [Duncaniella sp.]